MPKNNTDKNTNPCAFALPKTGADAHAHLDLKFPDNEIQAIIEKALETGLSTIMQVFLNPDNYYNNKAKFENYPEIQYTLGVHPSDASELDNKCLAKMRKCFKEDSRLRAVGEIGLDYYWDTSTKELQDKVFRLQLNLAKELDLPVVIHCRDAEDDTFKILKEEAFIGRPLLWHCFGGDKAIESMDKIIENGWHISIPGPVTYPKNVSLREAVKRIPRDKLVLETDCPYLTPQVLRGKRNEPALIAFTAKEVANCLEMPINELWTLCGNNTRRFFGI